MMQRLIKLLPIIIICILVYSCSKTDDIFDGSDYPVSMDNEWTYKVTDKKNNFDKEIKLRVIRSDSSIAEFNKYIFGIYENNIFIDSLIFRVYSNKISIGTNTNKFPVRINQNLPFVETKETNDKNNKTTKTKILFKNKWYNAIKYHFFLIMQSSEETKDYTFIPHIGLYHFKLYALEAGQVDIDQEWKLIDFK